MSWEFISSEISIRARPGLAILGYYDDRPDDRTADLPADISVKLGKLSTLVESARRGEVQVIYITLPMRAEQRIRDVIQELADTTASVYIVPDLVCFPAAQFALDRHSRAAGGERI